MCNLYRKDCEDFLASHFDFLCSLDNEYDKRFSGMFLGCGADIEFLSGVLHRPLKWCVHKMEDLYYQEIEYIDKHFQSWNARAAVAAWKQDNDIPARIVAGAFGNDDEGAARAWLCSIEKCKKFCNKEKCKCIRDMVIVDCMVSWKKRYKFIA